METAPRELDSTPSKPHQKAGEARHKDEASKPVDSQEFFFDGASSGLQPDDQWHDYQTQGTEGEIDDEDPSPGSVLRKQSSDQWPGDGPKGPRNLNDTPVLGSLSKRDNVAEYHHGESNDASAAHALDRPPCQ